MNNSKLKDHRQIGRELELFFFHAFAPGTIFWLPKGWTIYQTLVDFIRKKTENDGYQEISTPVMVKSELFKQSGHWEHFGEHNMFNLAIYEPEEIAADKVPSKEIGGVRVVDVNYSLKPMNCPEAALVYSSQIRSYSNLPLKLTEFGILHRRELSGVLGGLFRVRQFVIDDAHLFVRPDQIQTEIKRLLQLTMEVYQLLGFAPRFYLATRPDKAMGDKGSWQEAEADLEKALRAARVNFSTKPKEGAFYGPKIDIHINDSQNRDWQLATIQLDFQIPERMKLVFVDKDGQKKRPVMIHRGIFGSLERFIGILLEHTQGKLPFWLAPIQVIVLPVSEKNFRYATKVSQKIRQSNIRCEVDERSETLQAKIRDATLQKIPYLLVVGPKEEEKQTMAVRTREGKDEGAYKIKEFINLISPEIAKLKTL